MHHKGILGCFLWLKETGDFFCSEIFGGFFGEKWCRRLVFFWKLLDETREFLDETSISINGSTVIWWVKWAYGYSMWCVSVCRWIIPPALSYTQPGKATRYPCGPSITFKSFPCVFLHVSPLEVRLIARDLRFTKGPNGIKHLSFTGVMSSSGRSLNRPIWKKWVKLDHHPQVRVNIQKTIQTSTYSLAISIQSTCLL